MIDGNFIQMALIDVGKSVAGLSIASALDLSKKLDFGNSFVTRNVSNGSISFVTSDLIDGLLSSGQQSKILKMDIVGAMDDTLFFSAVSAGVEVSGVSDILQSAYGSTLGLSRDTTELITDSTILSASRIAAKYVDQQGTVPTYLKNIRYPVRTLMSMAN
jgi:hypothetical protein